MAKIPSTSTGYFEMSDTCEEKGEREAIVHIQTVCIRYAYIHTSPSLSLLIHFLSVCIYLSLLSPSLPLPLPPPHFPSLQLAPTIIVHNLCSSQLLVRGVHLATEHLVQSTCSSQNDVRVVNLYDSLTETNQICTDANGSARYLDDE